MATFKVKRGDDLEIIAIVSLDGSIVDLTGWIVRCQARLKDELIHEFTVEIPDPAGGQVNISAPAAITEGWAVGTMESDIELVDDEGKKTSTDTFTIEVIKDITRAA